MALSLIDFGGSIFEILALPLSISILIRLFLVVMKAK